MKTRLLETIFKLYQKINSSAKLYIIDRYYVLSVGRVEKCFENQRSLLNYLERGLQLWCYTSKIMLK